MSSSASDVCVRRRIARSAGEGGQTERDEFAVGDVTRSWPSRSDELAAARGRNGSSATRKPIGTIFATQPFPSERFDLPAQAGSRLEVAGFTRRTMTPLAFGRRIARAGDGGSQACRATRPAPTRAVRREAGAQSLESQDSWQRSRRAGPARRALLPTAVSATGAPAATHALPVVERNDRSRAHRPRRRTSGSSWIRT